MLTVRQRQIFDILEKKTDGYLKGTSLITSIGCSLKTLQTEIKELKTTLSPYHMEIKSVTSKGYRLVIHDEKQRQDFKKAIVKEDNGFDFNNQGHRINYILNSLLIKNQYIKANTLADEMYISRSSISSDIKIVKRILEKYHLCIEHRPNYGMKVNGTEKDKRICIVKEQLCLDDYTNDIKAPNKEWISTISGVIVENLMRFKYRISDIVLQNLVLHVYVAIHRMKHNVYVDKDSRSYRHYENERSIAKEILTSLAILYQIDVKDSEVEFLALLLLGKRSYEENDIITSQMDIFINELLTFIKKKLSIDFFGDMELKISLALHLVSMFVRLEHGMQLENNMILDIRSNFPLAYNVAVIASSYINEKKQVMVSDDEIGYLAIHFSLSLQKLENKVNPKKVLVICNARRGDFLMIQHIFLREFREIILALDIINAIEISQYDLDTYDCIFTTFLNHPNIPTRALRINFFIDKKDIQRIQRALTGESEAKELLKYFQEEVFIANIKATTKEEVIYELCKRATKHSTFEEDLYESCLRREKLGKTSYTNWIALPHPDALIAKKTVVVTAVSKKPIDWQQQKVQIIFLICVKKGNQKDLRILFECISKFMMDKEAVEEVIFKADYSTFINHLGKLIG